MSGTAGGWFATTWREHTLVAGRVGTRDLPPAERTSGATLAEVVVGGLAGRAVSPDPREARLRAERLSGRALPSAPYLPAAAPAVTPPEADPGPERASELLASSALALTERGDIPLRLTITQTHREIAYANSLGVAATHAATRYLFDVTPLDPRRAWPALRLTGADPARLLADARCEWRWRSAAGSGGPPSALPTVVLKGEAARAFLYPLLDHRTDASGPGAAPVPPWLRDDPAAAGSTRSRPFDDAGFPTRPARFVEPWCDPQDGRPRPGRLRLAGGRPEPLITALTAAADAGAAPVNYPALVVERGSVLNDSPANDTVAFLAGESWRLDAPTGHPSTSQRLSCSPARTACSPWPRPERTSSHRRTSRMSLSRGWMSGSSPTGGEASQ